MRTEPGRVARLRRRRRRRAARAAGVGLVATGLALLGFVGFELWGTGVATAHAQAAFRAEVRHHGIPARPIVGGVAGFIRIPAISLDMAFVQGISQDDLARGPGHYPGSPMPGLPGNVAIAGHRTTHLAPFWALDSLRQGDRIELQTRRGTFVYEVRWVRVVLPSDRSVLGRTRVPSLTLTTCFPRFSASHRLVVRAVEVPEPI
jgi:sortase A